MGMAEALPVTGQGQQFCSLFAEFPLTKTLIFLVVSLKTKASW